MARKPKKTENLVLVLAEKEDGDFHHIELHVRQILDGALRGFSSLDYDNEAYADLHIGDQLSRTMTLESRESYAWHCEYRNAFAVDLARAKRMVKLLSHVERQMTDAEWRLGSPKSFQEYVLRIASILGITAFVVFEREPRGVNDLGDWRTLTPNEAAGWIERANRGYVDKWVPQKDESAA
jgi:hypothetical protein